MSNTTIERPMAGDAVLCQSKYGPLKAWLVRYVSGTTALVELCGGGFLHIAVDHIALDPEAALR